MCKVLALIPARIGSRGIARKNVRELGGRPLVAWSIEAAKKSRYPLRVVCSTDDDEIAAIAEQWGAEVPFRRPPELATDQASTLSVALHALETLPGTWTHLLLLQPTSPLRTAQDIDGALDRALESGAKAVVSVSEAESHPYLTYLCGENLELTPFCQPQGISLRRQDLPPAYVLNGSIYVNRVESLRSDQTFFPANTLAYLVPKDRSLDLDDLEQWNLAEKRLRSVHG